ncbi:MAG: hypothetical protein RSF42_13480 [Comamonas sp.]
MGFASSSGQGAAPRGADYQSAQLARECLLASWENGVTMAELEAVSGRDRWSEIVVFFMAPARRVL